MVVSADCDEEKYDLNVVEHVDPLLTLRPLSTNVKHAVCQVASVENSLADASCSKPCAQNILICGCEVFGEKAIEVGEVAGRLLVVHWHMEARRCSSLLKIVM